MSWSFVLFFPGSFLGPLQFAESILAPGTATAEPFPLRGDSLAIRLGKIDLST